jgi:hypothetical protein
MRKLNIASFAVVAAALVGCADDPEQSLNGVFPSSGFIGRKVRVEVSGDNASFKDGVSLDFGPGVTVSSVSVASPTAIFAELTIADSAALGARDVVANSGSTKLTLKEAFVLQSPVEVEFQGTLAQGSVVSFTALNLDLTKLYDSTCGASIFGICLLYTNMDVVTPTGVTAVVNTVEPFRISGTLFVDIDAMAGDIKFVSGPVDNADKQVTSAMGKSTDFMARMPTVLAANTASTATVAGAFDSHLYSFDAAATSVGRYSASPSDTNASPRIYVLPSSGHFADLVAAAERPAVITETAGKHFAIYADSSGLSGYSYAMRVNPVQLMGLAEADASGANDTLGTAQNAMANSAILFSNASVSSDTDEDWIRFTVPANSAAKKVRVVTGGSDTLTDTYVEIWKDATPAPSMIAEGADSGYHEDVTSPAIGAAATIWVKIYGSPGFFDIAHKNYTAAIWLE